MKKMTCVALAALMGLSICVRDVIAWGDDGHQIVGRIAARKLTAKTKRRIVAILRNGGDDQLHLPALLGAPGDPPPSLAALAEAFGRMATWPDHMPGGKGKTEPWHFIDIGLFEGPNTAANRCATGCVTQMIDTLKSNLIANKSITIHEDDGTTRRFPVDKELRFLIHFLGDIHQPLHASTNADAGGNCVKTTGFTHDGNLHHTW
ncbi:MAG TPA: S1/P1 nuclease, partial [Vicinamibacterales bacterium]|nr:S1/P1 nuclease [Vicinamibacterales bacterium]